MDLCSLQLFIIYHIFPKKSRDNDNMEKLHILINAGNKKPYLLSKATNTGFINYGVKIGLMDF